MLKFSLAILFLFLNICLGFQTYNSTQANIGVYLSGSAYCGKSNYTSMSLIGPAKGFVVTGILYDAPTDLEGFVGYMDLTKTSHIVLRGSSSVLNWLDDFEVKQIDYTTWPDCGCKVHDGFYKAALGLRNETLRQVKMLIIKNPGYKIILNGHSLAAAVLDLLSMELLKDGIKSELYIYGKPRVGDNTYSKYFDSKNLIHFRHTHNKDMVPHLPPTNGLGYYHSCQEIFEDEFSNIKFCSQTDCEDKTCGNQYNLVQTNTDDHLYYLSHRVDCESSTL